MIVHIAVAFLLGASATLSEGSTSCIRLRSFLLKIGKLKLKDSQITGLTNFGNTIKIVRKTDVQPTTKSHVFSVHTNEEILPGVTVESISYKLQSLEIDILNPAHGTAVMAVIFSSDENTKSARKVIFVIPLLAVAENDASFNEALNSVLRGLGATPKQQINENNFAWLQELLSNVSVMEPTPENVRAYLTECQKVVIDHYLLPAF